MNKHSTLRGTVITHQTGRLLTSRSPSRSVIAWIEDMLERDVNDNKKIGNYGAQHILSGVPRDSVTILTHCNTGSLATAGYGTALGEIGVAGVNERGRRELGYLQSRDS